MFAQYSLWLIILSIFSFLVVAPIHAQDDGGTQQNLPFKMAMENPVIDRNLHEILDNRYSNPGAMVYHDGQFHMFRNGFASWPGRVYITYLTSPDGLNWEMGADEVLLTRSDVDYAGVLIMVSSVHVEDDGMWVLYFYTWDNYTAPVGEGRIGRLTAPAPTGPWTATAEPLLDVGSTGTWDAQQVGVPLVVKHSEQYWMYYSGFSERGEMRIGLATSQDGLHWEKYNDPSNDDDPLFAESDPVLEASLEDWDRNGVERPRVIVTDSGWVMLYRAKTASAGLGLATSQDGIHWEKVNTDPIFEIAQIPHATGIFLFTFLKHEDTYYLYTEATLDNQSTSEIFLLTADNLLANTD